LSVYIYYVTIVLQKSLRYVMLRDEIKSKLVQCRRSLSTRNRQGMVRGVSESEYTFVYIHSSIFIHVLLLIYIFHLHLLSSISLFVLLIILSPSNDERFDHHIDEIEYLV